MMKRSAVRYGIVGAALVMGLSFWGWCRIGTADALLPEETEPAKKGASLSKRAMEPAAFGEEAGKEENRSETAGVLLYDASTWRRDRSMTDPFRLPSSGEESIQKEENHPASPKAAIPDVPRRQEAPIAQLELRGILQQGEDRRAILQEGSRFATVREGETFGPWTITGITGAAVTLSGPEGSRVLTLAP